jgi:outer membrane protein assembly factor BamE (lipoprotein component of BamABCDE complex)
MTIVLLDSRPDTRAARRAQSTTKKRSIAITFTALATMAIAPPVAAQYPLREVEASGGNALQPRHVDHIGVRATLLYLGMQAVSVERIMGTPTLVDAAKRGGGSVRVLKYPLEPIGTEVTITDAKVSGVALDIAGVDDPALPNFSRAVWLGMTRTAVLRLLGKPSEDRIRAGDGMSVEQMIFERPDQQVISIFLIDGRVAAKKVGSSFPANIFSFALPLTADPVGNEIDEVANWSKLQRIRVGMKMSEVQTLFGVEKMRVDYSFKGKPAAHMIFETSPGKSFARFTFIENVLTEFADGGATPLSLVLDGH